MPAQKRIRNNTDDDEFVSSLKRHKSNQLINVTDYGMLFLILNLLL